MCRTKLITVVSYHLRRRVQSFVGEPSGSIIVDNASNGATCAYRGFEGLYFGRGFLNLCTFIAFAIVKPLLIGNVDVFFFSFFFLGSPTPFLSNRTPNTPLASYSYIQNFRPPNMDICTNL